MYTTRFYIGKGSDRMLIAIRTSRMGKVDFEWMKPAHVVERLDLDQKVSMEGDAFPPIFRLSELAPIVWAKMAERAKERRGNLSFIRWCANEWNTWRGMAETCLQAASDWNVCELADRYESGRRQAIFRVASTMY